MENIFLFLVILMFILAVSDLIVGVSNDAVNFLNSAVGAKAGTFRLIMIIASLGIVFGASFSSGMMEVARKGVFNPEFFAFEDIMILFVTVMITDIILLDLFNSLALPTSTTVSIVFELLGSAIAVSYFRVVRLEGTLASWGDYINGDRALLIIASIFLSVVIAFFIGWIVQYISRLLVTFDYKKYMKSWGSILGASAVAFIIYFILLVGLKSSSLAGPELKAYLQTNLGLVFISVFVISLIVFQILVRSSKKFDVFQFITLLGTFALAMAFASNDLVNFIGVPIASYDSYTLWTASGEDPKTYMMDSLKEPVRTNPFFLVAAGLIMAITLWTSKKARSVIATTVNLGRQNEGAERFKGNEVARGIVKATMAMADSLGAIFGKSIQNRVNQRFDESKAPEYDNPEDKPAFDMVRAAVNLTMAAALISVGTLLKLPLSTTYVSFMVAMGASLADKAWARGSAVYRVSGVFTVIAGWFMTAIIAMTVSIVFASLIVAFKGIAIAGLVLFMIFMVLRNRILFRNQAKVQADLTMADEWFKTDFENIKPEVKNKIIGILKRSEAVYEETLNALIDKDRKSLRSRRKAIKEITGINELYKAEITSQIKEMPLELRDKGKFLLYIYDLEDDLLTAMIAIHTASETHVSNIHPDITEEQKENLRKSVKSWNDYLNEIYSVLEKDHISDSDYNIIMEHKFELIKQIERAISRQIEIVNEENLSAKNSQLILTILFSTKDIVAISARFVKLFYRTQDDNRETYLVDGLSK